jgi:mono/diheme cytochrome c family protein
MTTIRAAALLVLLGLALVPIQANPQVLVPAYQASYSSSEDLLKQILAEVRGLRADLRAGGGGGAATLAGVVQQRCAQCHTSGKEDRGGDFVLLEKDGKLAELSLNERRRLLRLVQKGEMPPPPIVLSDGEKKVLVDFVNSSSEKEKRQ